MQALSPKSSPATLLAKTIQGYIPGYKCKNPAPVSSGRSEVESMELRPFYRVFHLTKYQAAAQQIDAAIEAFHAGHFAVTVTLAGAAESMAAQKAGELWEIVRDNPNRPIADDRGWIRRLNATRDWLKHNKKDEPTRNLVAFEAGVAILRAMDKWEPWTPSMEAFKAPWFNSSPKLMRPDDYVAEPEA